MKKLLVALALIIFTLGVFACSNLRKVTYPPSFVYIEKKEIQTTMKRFAANILVIEKSLERNAIVNDDDKKIIVASLDDILSSANQLDSGAQRTNHWLVDHNISAFKESVERAKRMILHSPANYYLAGQLSGKCQACHSLKAR